MVTYQSTRQSHPEAHTQPAKLIILPGSPQALGGTLVSLMMTLRGLDLCGQANRVCVLVPTQSLMEDYLMRAGLGHCLVSIPATTKLQFIHRALRWVEQQPRHYPLLLENCVQRNILLPLVCHSSILRWQRRSVYLLFRDLATSHNPLGYIARKLTFLCLHAKALCNSYFTAQHIHHHYAQLITGILYPPVDLTVFNPQAVGEMPPAWHDIRRTGMRVMLTVSRINEPGIVNDKNLKIIPAILAELKQRGHDYYGVIIGQDRSPNQERSQALLALAQALGVGDRFQLLPPSFQIASYYRHADVLVTLAPREPFGRTVVEAIACGLPVIGSNTGGIQEILANFAPEWTVDAHDAAAAAEAIIALADSPTVSATLARGQAWIQEHCSVVKSAQALLGMVGLMGDVLGDVPGVGDDAELL